MPNGLSEVLTKKRTSLLRKAATSVEDRWRRGRQLAAPGTSPGEERDGAETLDGYFGDGAWCALASGLAFGEAGAMLDSKFDEPVRIDTGTHDTDELAMGAVGTLEVAAVGCPMLNLPPAWPGLARTASVGHAFCRRRR